MALKNETVGTKYGAAKLQSFLQETLYEQNFMHLKDDLPNKDNPTVFSRSQGVAAGISMALKSLPAWALESIDSVIDGKTPDNLTFEAGAFDPELRGKDIVSYFDALSAGIRDGKIKPTDMARAEEYYLDKTPELAERLQAETADKKFGIDRAEQEKNREATEKHKEELSKEVAKDRLKREIKEEKAFQKIDAKENRQILRAQKARGKYMDRDIELKKSVLERNEKGRMVRKPGVSDRQYSRYQKNHVKFEEASQKYGKLRDAAQKRVSDLFKDGKVTAHYKDYRTNQLETGELSYKVAQSFQRQEWNKAMLERAGIDKLPKAEQQAKIEEFRKQVTEANEKKAQAPEKRKVEPAEIGMDKKEPEKKSVDVKKEAPTVNLTKTK